MMDLARDIRPVAQVINGIHTQDSVYHSLPRHKRDHGGRPQEKIHESA